MSNPPQSESGRWLALIASLPTENPAARMRGLRTLESLGAAVIREGVYLLPETSATRQGLELSRRLHLERRRQHAGAHGGPGFGSAAAIVPQDVRPLGAL